MFYEFFVGLSKSISTIGLVVLMLIWIDFGTKLLWRLSSTFPMYSISPSSWALLARSMGFNFTSHFLVVLRLTHDTVSGFPWAGFLDPFYSQVGVISL